MLNGTFNGLCKSMTSVSHHSLSVHVHKVIKHTVDVLYTATDVVVRDCHHKAAS